MHDKQDRQGASWAEADIQELIRLIGEGKTCEQAARLLGRDPDCVARELVRLVIQPPKPKPQLPTLPWT